MSCFPCFSGYRGDDDKEKSVIPIARPVGGNPPTNPSVNKSNQDPLDDIRNAPELEDNTVKSFTFREIATATKNFRQEFLLGEGGFGKVFKGTLQSTGQTVAVRQLERNTQGNNFVFEISNLSLLQHPSLVKMIGYCADGEQRFLVYEYMPTDSLKNHLFDLRAGEKPLDWTQRMKIALGIAEGLEYLHEKADTTVIYRDLRSSNILLTEMLNPKLADYGLAKIVEGGNTMHMSVMTGFNGYCAPEFEMNGELTVKSDVFSFGVVLLELITGRKALDTSLPAEEQSLVCWARPLFKDPSKFPEMADPLLRKGFAITSLNQAVGAAAMCLMEEPVARPLISDVSAALSFLAMAPPQAPVPDLTPILSRNSTARQGKHDDASSDSEVDEEEEDEHDYHQDEQQHDYNSDEYNDSSDEEENADKVQCSSTKLISKSVSVKKSMKMEPSDSCSSSDDDEPPSTQLQLPQYHDHDNDHNHDDDLDHDLDHDHDHDLDHDHDHDRSSSSSNEEALYSCNQSPSHRSSLKSEVDDY